jgi:hypothetical protein
MGKNSEKGGVNAIFEAGTTVLDRDPSPLIICMLQKQPQNPGCFYLLLHTMKAVHHLVTSKGIN